MPQDRTYDVLAGVESSDPESFASSIATLSRSLPVPLKLLSDDADITERGEGVRAVGDDVRARLLEGDSLHPTTAELINYQLLAGRHVLVLHGVTEGDLTAVRDALDPALQWSGPMPGVPIDEGGTLAFALPARDDTRPEGHLSPITGAMLSSDGSTLATVDATGYCGVWDVRTGRLRSFRQVAAGQGGVELAGAIEGGDFLLANYERVFRWDGGQGAPRFSWPGHDPRISLDSSVVAVVDTEVVTWSEDGRQPFDTRDRVRLFALDSGNEVVSYPGRQCAFSPDGQLLAVVDGEETRIWSRHDGALVGVVAGMSPSWSQRGDLMSTRTRSGMLVFTMPDAELLTTIPWDSYGTMFRVAWAGSLIVFADTQVTTALDPRTGEEHVIAGGAQLWPPPVVSPAGDVVALCHAVEPSDGQTHSEIGFHDLRGRELLRVTGDNVVFHPAGRIAAVTVGDWPLSRDHSVLAPRTELWRLDGTGPIASVEGGRVAFHETGERLATASPDGRAWVWDGATGAPIMRAGDFVVLAARIAGGASRPAEEEPPAVPVERFVVVRHPDRVTAGYRFPIQASLAVRPPPDLELARPVVVIPSRDAQGRPTDVPDVEIRVWAPAGLAVVGPARAELPVLPDADSPVVRFEIEAGPESSGPYAIPVAFFQGPRVLGRVLAVLTITPAAGGVPASPPREVTASLVIEGGPHEDEVPSPDVVFSVVRSTAGTHDGLHWAYCWKAQGWRWIDAGTVTFGRPVQEWADEKYAALSALARPAQRQPGAVRTDLERLGHNL
jgi:WD40 repeat protein